MNDMKTMKAPVVEVTIEKLYIVTVAGKKLGSFRETDSMCDMKQLTGPNGSLVIDIPFSLGDLFGNLFDTNKTEPFKAAVIKASPEIIASMQAAIDELKAEKAQTIGGPSGVEGPVGPGPCPMGPPSPDHRPFQIADTAPERTPVESSDEPKPEEAE